MPMGHHSTQRPPQPLNGRTVTLAHMHRLDGGNGDVRMCNDPRDCPRRRGRNADEL